MGVSERRCRRTVIEQGVTRLRTEAKEGDGRECQQPGIKSLVNDPCGVGVGFGGDRGKREAKRGEKEKRRYIIEGLGPST